MKGRIADLLGAGDAAEALAIPRAKLVLVWLTILWERVWPAVWPAIGVLGLFLAAALFDILPLLPGWLHLVVLAAFAGAFAAAVIAAVRRISVPDAESARRRLEIVSGVPHRPLTGLLDHQAAGIADAFSRRLWQVHRQRLRDAVKRWRVGWPQPGLAKHDRHGMRAAVGLLLLLGIVAARGDWVERLHHAVTPQLEGAIADQMATLDLFITPPDYTGAPPLYLRPARTTPDGAEPAEVAPIDVPVNSTLLARVTGGGEPPVLALTAGQTAFDDIDGANYEITAEITGGDRISVEQAGAVLGSWPITVIADAPPTIRMAEEPAQSQRAAVRIEYEAADDYGIESAAATIALTEQALAAGPGLARDPIALELAIPGRRPREARAASYHDLTPHPWAGQQVTLTLSATDGAGQTGQSETYEFILPEREFNHPVARAIIEQRRTLMLDPSTHEIVAEVLETLSLRPDRFFDDSVVFLALRTAFRRLALARDAETVVDPVQRLLWDTALRIEDGGLSIAERDLREAQQALMDALDGDATDDEIRQLMDELREALNEYLKAMEENLMDQLARGEIPEMLADPEGQTVDRDQLNEMLEQMQELAESGAREAARDMLAQLQEMLENLQAGVMQQQQNAQPNPAMELMEDLQNLTRAQQELLDRTFRESQQGQQEGQSGENMPSQTPSRPGTGSGSQLGSDFGTEGAAVQEALRRALGEMMRQMDEMTGDIPVPLGRAEQSMRRSEQALGQGQMGEAVQPQADSVDQLQQGLQDFVDQVLEQMAQQNSGQVGQMMQQLNSGRDPLGRPMPNSGGMNTEEVGIPSQSDLQRARQILDELRRRSGQRHRPIEELDYIDRLMRQF